MELCRETRLTLFGSSLFALRVSVVDDGDDAKSVARINVVGGTLVYIVRVGFGVRLKIVSELLHIGRASNGSLLGTRDPDISK